MNRGYLCLVLHAHLPFVRHPEHEKFLEEKWLFEAISETYLPLLRVFDRLVNDGVPFRITLSISPTLAAMLTDELLQNRYVDHCRSMIALAEREMDRTEAEPQFRPAAKMYKELFQRNLADFQFVYKNDITRGFRALEKSGHLELITTAATHSFLPLYELYPQTVNAQIHTAVMSHGRVFGSDPAGFWLPECGYYPGLERHIKANGLRYFFTAAHGLLFGSERPTHGVYSPMECTNGTAVFGRDIPSSQAVWSADEGYPGDFSYRDFHRDIGFDLPLEYIRPWIHDDDIRVQTGFKYHAITGPGDNKRPYVPAEATKKAEEHAANFLYNRIKQVDKLTRLMDREPIVVCPYDAELFGHWWYEGPQWLEFLLRKVNDEQDRLLLTTPSDYLSLYPENQVATPSFSSWGNNGYSEVWLDSSNDWIYPHIHKAIERMGELVERFPDQSGLKLRALNQAAREVLLCQASDWPFIMKTGTTVPYAVRRVKEHLHNFTFIYEGLRRNAVKTEWLTAVEKKNNIFSDVDYRLFTRSAKPTNEEAGKRYSANSISSTGLTNSK